MAYYHFLTLSKEPFLSKKKHAVVVGRLATRARPDLLRVVQPGWYRGRVLVGAPLAPDDPDRDSSHRRLRLRR